MARGRRWTPDEDAQIRATAHANQHDGLMAGGRADYARRLQRLAAELGRTYAAVLRRANRIGAYSYQRAAGNVRGRQAESEAPSADSQG